MPRRPTSPWRAGHRGRLPGSTRSVWRLPAVSWACVGGSGSSSAGYLKSSWKPSPCAKRPADGPTSPADRLQPVRLTLPPPPSAALRDPPVAPSVRDRNGRAAAGSVTERNTLLRDDSPPGQESSTSTAGRVGQPPKEGSRGRLTRRRNQGSSAHSLADPSPDQQPNRDEAFASRLSPAAYPSDQRTDPSRISDRSKARPSSPPDVLTTWKLSLSQLAVAGKAWVSSKGGLHVGTPGVRSLSGRNSWVGLPQVVRRAACLV